MQLFLILTGLFLVLPLAAFGQPSTKAGLARPAGSHNQAVSVTPGVSAPGKKSVLGTAPSSSPPYEQAPSLIDLRSTYSDGVYDPEALVQMAVNKGIHVVFLNDHDRVVMEYGLQPFRNLLKKQVELNSINKMGAEKYLQSINGIRKRYPNVILMPGTESTPFYYWTGSPFTGKLTANDHERRILTMGLEKTEDYETLPILHNGLSGSHLRQMWPALAAFGLCFLIAVYLAVMRGWWRLGGILLSLLSAGFFFNTLLARPSPFDAYHGKQGVAPYQLFIDDVDRKGGLTFWNYPETRSGVRKMGPIEVRTLPYPEMLSEANNYTGFSAIYGDTSTITDPGNIWDMVLGEYCIGFRARPPWGIATADFHKEGESGQKLGDFQTVLWLTEKSPRAALSALKNGKMYAASGAFPKIPKLDEFSVSAAAPETASRAISGDEIALERNPRIRIRVSGSAVASQSGSNAATQSGRAELNKGNNKAAKTTADTTEESGEVQVRLIRSGTLIQVFKGPLPLAIDFTDFFAKPGEKIYYRVDMTGYGKIISNPIFVKFTK
jgi:hypothetical protein